MAGPNSEIDLAVSGPQLTLAVEVFKFGFYMFFPVFVMFKFGDPQWYETYVQPVSPRSHVLNREALAKSLKGR